MTLDAHLLHFYRCSLGPHYEASATPEGYVTLSTDSYIDYFLKKVRYLQPLKVEHIV